MRKKIIILLEKTVFILLQYICLNCVVIINIIIINIFLYIIIISKELISNLFQLEERQHFIIILFNFRLITPTYYFDVDNSLVYFELSPLSLCYYIPCVINRN